MDKGNFILYSIGWNETDDGDTPALTKGGSAPQKTAIGSGPRPHNNLQRNVEFRLNVSFILTKLTGKSTSS